MWDNLTCWHSAQIGEVVVVDCPELFSQFTTEDENGQWRGVFPVLLLLKASSSSYHDKCVGLWIQPGFREYYNSFVSSRRYRMFEGLCCGFSGDSKK